MSKELTNKIDKQQPAQSVLKIEDPFFEEWKEKVREVIGQAIERGFAPLRKDLARLQAKVDFYIEQGKNIKRFR